MFLQAGVRNISPTLFNNWYRYEGFIHRIAKKKLPNGTFHWSSKVLAWIIENFKSFKLTWQCQRPSPSFPAPDSIGHFENFGKHFRENGLIFASNILHNDCTRKLTLPRTDCPIVDDGPSGMMINIKSQNKKALPLTH